MFNKDDILKFRLFCHEICANPRSIEAQPYKREGTFLWCEDWEIIEILKYLFNGKVMYYEDPPPNRLKNNPLWNKEDIEKKAEALVVELVETDKIIEHLRAKRQ